jgi:signal transduction histidine kinase
MGYAPWIREVWMNLLSNAFKYAARRRALELGGVPDGSHVRFWVRQRRPVVEEERGRVFSFTRLHQERATGHGLGLTTVQRIVSKLGGMVWVDAVIAEAASSVSLPAAPSAARK